MENLKRFIRKINQDTKISHKFYISVICAIIIPLIFLGFIFYSKLKQTSEEVVSISNEQIFNQYVDYVNYKFDIYLNLIENITINGMVQDIFLNQDWIKFENTIETSKKVSKEINSLIVLKNASEVKNIMLYADNEEFPTDGDHISNIGYVKDEPWYQKIKESKNYNYLFHHITPGLKTNTISMVRPIIDTSHSVLRDKLGLVKLDIYADTLFNNVQLKGKSNDIYILDETRKVVFSNNKNRTLDLSEAELEDVLGRTEGRQVVNAHNKKAVLFYKKINNYNWEVLFIFYYDTLANKLKEIWMYMSLAAAILIIVLIMFMTGFSKPFSKRLELLIKKLKKVESGDFEITEIIEGQDEIGIIDKNFNSMVGELKRLINENYIQNLERREAELNALQFQINPHFLYNTLESINSIAAVYKCQEICNISQKLGEMFRYSINIGRSEFTTLEKEIEHIKNYIYIQKIRFKDKFEVYYDIPDELKMLKTLKFILQPIVENSLFHGFEGRNEKGSLEVSASLEARNLILRIKDDGKGMTDEQVDSLNSYISDMSIRMGNQDKRSIGIRNVNARIKLAFGDNYGIVIMSRQNVGTQVVITLPVHGQIKGDGNVQNSDC